MTDLDLLLPGLEPEDPVATRVARLEAELAQASGLLARLAQQVTGSGDAPAPRAPGDGAGAEPARWPWFVLGDIEDDATFPVWVAWLGGHYVIPETGKPIVYDCWAKHDAVVAELARVLKRDESDLRTEVERARRTSSAPIRRTRPLPTAA